MYRIGNGYDVHKLVENRKLILGGVDIPSEKGVLGHSDGDVLLHAIIDAILGALCLGDIGSHFPDTDSKYLDIDSMKLLLEVKKLMEEKNYSIVNLDATVVLQKPKIRDFIDIIRENISKNLNLEIDRINIKATTEEHLGFTGSSEGVKSYCAILLKRGN